MLSPARVRSERMWHRYVLLLVAVACAVSLPGASAEAPWSLTRGTLTVEEVPTGNAWQTRSYLLSDVASKQAAVCALASFPCSPRSSPVAN